MNILAKVCSKCKQEKSFDDFYTDRRTPDSKTFWCKSCVKQNQETRYSSASFKAKNRRFKLRRNYGISLEDYDAFVAAQGGKCALCQTPPPGGSRNGFRVDHDHKTGAVRGLLCNA